MKRNTKKLGIVLIYISFSLILICFFNCNISKNKKLDSKYSNYVGYINLDSALITNRGKLCNPKKIFGTHHGLPEYAFEVSKKHFKTFIQNNYNNNNYDDSGYINFRFLINCDGIAGWFEIIEMNLDLEEVELNDEMVNQLLKLTYGYECWRQLSVMDKGSIDYYMYISYRIENGKITEILP